MNRKFLLFPLLMVLFAPLAMAQTTLYSEDFENGSIPSGWTQEGPGTWVVTSGDHSTSTGAGQGTYNALCDHTSRNNVTKLITSEIDLSSAASAELSFMHIQRAWGSDIDALRVYYRTSNSGTWTTLVEYTNAYASWTTESGIVLPYLSATYQLAFECTDNYGYGVGLDDIIIIQGSSCPNPTGLTYEVTSTGYHFSWDPETGASFQYSKTLAGEMPSWWLDTGHDGSDNYFDYPFDELEPNADVLFWVRKKCSDDEFSNYAYIGFHTPCDAITSFPWAEDFEGYASGNFTDPCWVNEHISGDGTQIFKVYTSTTGNNSTHQLQLPDMSQGTMTKLVLPKMALPGDDYEFVIDVYRSNSTYNSSNIYEGIRVFVSTNGEIEGATELAFIPRQYNTENEVIPAEEAIGWYTYELPIGISGTCYIILQGESQYCTSTFMDNFQVKQTPTCLPPTGLAMTQSATDYHFTWNAEADATFDYSITPAGETPTAWLETGNNGSDNYLDCPYSALSPNTDLVFWVHKKCGANDYSDPVSVEFRTPCEAIATFPWTEDFTGLTAGIPDCWDNTEGTTTDESYRWSYYDDGHDDAPCLRFDSYYNNTDNTNFLKTPALNFPANTVMQLCFWYKNPTGGDFSVYISTDGGTTYTTSLATGLTDASDWTNMEIDLVEYTNAQGVVIVFKGTSNYGYNDAYIYLDEVIVREAPDCMHPTGLTMAQLTTGYHFTWDAEADATFEYSITPAGETPTGWLETGNNGNDNYVDCPFSTFDPSADVIFWVHKKCGSDEFSDPVSVGFHTPCSAYAVTDENYFYDFETSEPMDCWRALSGDIERYENSNNAYSGDYHLRFSGSSLSRIIALPLFEEATNTLRLELYTRPESYTYPSCGTFDIGYMTNLDDANSFVPVETYSYDEWSSNTNEKKTINFTDAPADAYIALRHNAFSSPYYWYVDDVTVRLAPDCLEPSGVQLQEGSLTAHGATFEWDALEGEYFQFAVLEGIVTDFSSVTWSEAIQNDHAELTASLNPESDYTFVIRKYCSATNQSEPVALNFHTLEACPAPTELEVTDVAAHSATIDWTGTSQNQNYKVWYRKAAGISPVLTEDFEDEGTFNARWTVVNMSTENENRIGLDYYAAHQGSYGFRFSSWSNSNTYEEYLINKNALTGITEGSVIEFYYMKYASSPYESFKVGYSSTNNETSSFTFGDEHEATGEWQLFQETIPVGTKYVAIRYTTTDCNYYLYIDDIAIGQPVAAGSWNYDETTEIPYTIHGLTPETLYEAYIQGLCGSDGDSDPSETVTFTTTEDCPMPVNFTASNLTTTSADLSWEGISEVESYTVRYRTAEQIQGFNEHFDNSDIPSGWTRYSGTLNDDGTATLTSGSAGWFFGTFNNVFENHAYINLYAQKSYWLVTPSITVGNGYYLNFDVAYTAYSGVNAAPVPNCTTHRFVVLISTDNEHWTILREYNNSGSSYVLDEISPYGQNAGAISLANYVGQTVYIAFFAHSESSEYDNNLHIDNVGIGQIIAAGAWQTVTVSGTNSVEAGTTLTGLTANTIYESQVKSDCSNNAWSEQIRFTTLPYKRFVTTGDWNVDSNWEPAGVPETGDDVIVDAAAVIPASYVANVGHITLGTNGAITIKDGGQLRHTNASTDGVTVTLEKEITGYGTSTDADHYYFIAPAPFIQTISPNSVVNLKTNDYDFYSFYAAASDGLEWINLHESTTSLKSAHGYLYANSEDVTLKSTGPAISITGGAALSIQYDPTANYSYNGWELAGNPYVCNGYVKVTKSNEIVETDFYRMNTDGDGYDLISSADALAPYEGVLVFIEGEQGQYEIGFSPDPIASNSGKLNMNLSRNGKSVDMARVRFGKGQNLGKMTFHENSSKVFIPMDGKDYAMVYSEGNMGEMPVSFKAERNGSYTLSFTNEDVTFSYLHLIDNLTGVETDLLENPSYSFEASTTDYTQRFRLVFTTGTSVDGDSFGFVNASGNLCIFGIEGEATVQVIDILGHVISSETFSGSYEKKINGAPGVYVIRLINGNDVKVQKVVVR